MSKDFEEKSIEFIFEDEVECVIDKDDHDKHDKNDKHDSHDKDDKEFNIIPNKPVYKNEFQVKACEELKEVCVDTILEDTVKLVKIKAKVSKLCPDRKVAIAVQLVDTCTKQIISQKGRIVETGCAPKCTNTIYENFIFALPGCLCDESNVIKVNIVANYILDYKYQECSHCNDHK